jgi:hypothetical protein
MAEARTRMSQAYDEAGKVFLRLKLDDAFETLEKERREFLVNSGILAGKKKYLVELKHFNLKVLDNNWFSKHGTSTILKSPIRYEEALVPHSILIHPDRFSTSEVSFNLNGKWAAIRTTVGIPKIISIAEDAESKLTFEILGDGKSLWKSEPVNKLETFQTSTVNVEKVKILTLRVYCPGGNYQAHSTWFEPILIEP